MMIEPTSPASVTPVIDELTRKMAAAWRHRKDAEDGYRGLHVCRCGVRSDNLDHWIDGALTNSLCVHYLAFHRSDVPATEIAKVRALRNGEAHPTDKELAAPEIRWGARRG